MSIGFCSRSGALQPVRATATVSDPVHRRWGLRPCSPNGRPISAAPLVVFVLVAVLPGTKSMLAKRKAPAAAAYRPHQPKGRYATYHKVRGRPLRAAPTAAGPQVRR